jgi:hypothetical protein
MSTKFAVVILNWNGASDTIECLKSISSGDPLAVPVVVDNGSSDDSIPRIRSVVLECYGGILEGDAVSVMSNAMGSRHPVLLSAGENLGFAKGSNLGLKVAKAAGYDVSVFLNNDTVVEPGALTRLTERLNGEVRIDVAIPLLTVYGEGKIWNCGGEASLLGYRRYYQSGRMLAGLSLPDEIPCTFFTGCCFAVRTDRFLQRQGFTERFFFGEEDFELSLWMKDHGWKAVCMTDCVVHHKVSASIGKALAARQASKVFVHYLNRFIHMRMRLGQVRWRVWLTIYLPYIITLLLRNRIITAHEAGRFFSALVRRATVADSVNRSDFESIMRGSAW